MNFFPEEQIIFQNYDAKIRENRKYSCRRSIKALVEDELNQSLDRWILDIYVYIETHTQIRCLYPILT